MVLIKEPKMNNLYEQNLNWLKSKNFVKSLKIEEEPECQNCGASIHDPKNTTCPTCLENYKENEDDSESGGVYLLTTDYGKLVITLYNDEPELVSGTLNLKQQLPNQMLYDAKHIEHEAGLESLLTKFKKGLNVFESKVETDITRIGKSFKNDYDKLAERMHDIQGFEIIDTTHDSVGYREEETIQPLSLSIAAFHVHTSTSYDISIEKAKMNAEELYNKFEALLDVMTEYYKK